jgi:putative flippase GtrA
VVRFTTGGCLNLLNRLVWAFLFETAGMPVWLNYGLVHAITLIFGYTWHTRITFRQKPGLRSFGRFVLSIAALRVTDYCLVVAVNLLEPVRAEAYTIPAIGSFVGDNLLYMSIAVVSIVMFFIRYTIFRKVTFAERGGSEEER